jgi:hypothetical protein
MARLAVKHLVMVLALVVTAELAVADPPGRKDNLEHWLA